MKWLRWGLLGASTALSVVLVVLWAMFTQPLVGATPSQPPAVDTQALETHVRTLSEKFHPRSHKNRTQLDAAAAPRGQRD